MIYSTLQNVLACEKIRVVNLGFFFSIQIIKSLFVESYGMTNPHPRNAFPVCVNPQTPPLRLPYSVPATWRVPVLFLVSHFLYLKEFLEYLFEYI